MISIKNFVPFEFGQSLPKSKRVRFEVTFSQGGVPLYTSGGWTIDEYRTVRSPGSRTKYGHVVSFGTIHKQFQALLQCALDDEKEVTNFLGPRKEKVSEIRKRTRLEQLDVQELVVVGDEE